MLKWDNGVRAIDGGSGLGGKGSEEASWAHVVLDSAAISLVSFYWSFIKQILYQEEIIQCLVSISPSHFVS